jgi:hypothetical protein
LFVARFPKTQHELAVNRKAGIGLKKALKESAP